MQQLLTTILSQQPWAVPVLACIATFALGLLIPKKAGGNWLSGIVFFLPNLLLDLLDIVHTKKFKYYGLILALLCIETFFAFRSSTVYYEVLGPHLSSAESFIVAAVMFGFIGIGGLTVATYGKLKDDQGKFKGGPITVMLFVIAHDWAGTIYMNYVGSTEDVRSDPLKAMLTAGMCVLSILPFIMGYWTEELRPELEVEMEESVNAFTALATRKIKRRAVDRVLRLATHTNVVHLVRALPADEFSDFKAFVMPIIAPGLPHNLTEQNPSTEQSIWRSDITQNERDVTGKVTEQSLSNIPQNISQNASNLTEQSLSEAPSNDSLETRQNDMQNDMPKPVTRAIRNRSTDKLNVTSKPVTKAALRDSKICQFAATHPDFTQAQLAKHFKVSISTIARALAGKPASHVNSHSIL